MSAIEEYWAAFFGLDVTDFLAPGQKLVAHAGLAEWNGAWLFRRGLSIVISVPPETLTQLNDQLRALTGNAISDHDFIALFGERVEKVIGPAHQGYLEEANFRPIPSSARLLAPADGHALQEFKSCCSPEEWEHSNTEIGGHPNFGLFLNGRLVAAANYEVLPHRAASPGLLTHPGYRGHGYGSAVLSAATEHGLTAGHLMLYQTLVANRPAVAAAACIGYMRYATHLAIRLK